ncbi:TSUP family transporter [Mesorhizobium sp. NBSH29]|uniref:sulfite exporter TauE/SafE family protein n=1 Tax=Mesorhizobium sp. NBSH29 TaxID=2654249 RepID=UPI0018968EE3|nr:sulfite exporter TauE/SafE family protein [Mesorhizobium sp. NBSH29]QPC88011.1 TSUP family transporter [Mesorhizobium sp. NBSH29]
MPDMSMGGSEIAMFVMGIAAAGVVAGLLAGVFGIGGGAVLVPVFYQVFGLLGVDEAVRMHLSVGSSLAIIVPTSIRSFTSHKARGAVDMDLLKSFLVSIPVGVVLAAIATASISSAGLRIVFTVVTVLVGIKLLFGRDHWRLGSEIPGNPWRSVVGTGIGFFSTLMGIGGGIMNNTFMTLYGRPMHQAVATSAGVGVMIAVPGAVGYIIAGWNNTLLPFASTGFVNWVAVALVIPIALVVTPYGVRIAHALSKRQLEIGFGLFCLLVALRFFASLMG